MYELKDCKVLKSHVCELKDCRSIKDHALSFEEQSLSKRNDAVVQPDVEGPLDDDRILAEAGAGTSPISTMVHVMRQRPSTG